MKNRSSLLGIVLILIGGLWLLTNLGYLQFNYGDVMLYVNKALEIWPLILVIVGTYLVTKKKSTRILVVLVCVAIWIMYVTMGPELLSNLQELIINGI